MNRAIMVAMTVIGLTTAASAASAASARFCATWAVPQFEDGDFGEGYLDLARTSPATTYHLAAKYTSVEVYKGETLVWSGQLSSSGCTGYMTVTTGHYVFRRYSRLVHGDREVRIMLDGWEWEEWSPDSLLKVDSSWNLYNPSGTFTLTAPNTATTYQGKMMPVFAQLLYRSETYDLLENGTTIWVSTDPVPLEPHSDGCGTQMWQGSESDYFHICISHDQSSWKFHIGHEYGHAVSKYKDGPTDGDYDGSEGYLRATGDDGRCNCDNVPAGSASHCLHSREFTGSGQKEGFSHFVATLGHNLRSTGGGVFVYYKDVRKWSSSHGGTLTWPLNEPPWPPPSNEYNPPFKVEVSNTDNVKWMEYECDPTGGWLEHYGTEWDWLSFFWNLWADVDEYEFSVNQIMTVWDAVANSDIAHVCCDDDVGDPPEACVANDPDIECGSGVYAAYPYTYTVGKLWDTDDDYDVTFGVKDLAYSAFTTDMGDNFRDKGDEAGVNH